MSFIVTSLLIVVARVSRDACRGPALNASGAARRPEQGSALVRRKICWFLFIELVVQVLPFVLCERCEGVGGVGRLGEALADGGREAKQCEGQYWAAPVLHNLPFPFQFSCPRGTFLGALQLM